MSMPVLGLARSGRGSPNRARPGRRLSGALRALAEGRFLGGEHRRQATVGEPEQRHRVVGSVAPLLARHQESASGMADVHRRRTGHQGHAVETAFRHPLPDLGDDVMKGVGQAWGDS